MVKDWCSTKVMEGYHVLGHEAACGPGCPFRDDGWATDYSLKLTHHRLDKKEIMIALKLLGILATSLLLIGLMVICLGNLGL